MNSRRKFYESAWVRKLSILVIICIAMAIFQPRFFLPQNMQSILLAICIYGTMVCGFMFCIMQGHIDLSVSATAALAACLCSCITRVNNFSTGGFFLGVIVALAASLAVGLINACIINFTRLPAIIVTLAIQYFLFGLTTAFMLNHPVTDGVNVYMYMATGVFHEIGYGRIFGVFVPVVIFIIIVILATLLLGKTNFGRNIYVVGGNPTAAKFVGIRTELHVIGAFLLSGFTAAIAGIMTAALNVSASASTCSGMEGYVLMAVVVGGMDLDGGGGSMLDAIFGALFVGILANVMILLGVDTDATSAMTGGLIILFLFYNAYTRKKAMQMGASVRMKAGGS